MNQVPKITVMALLLLGSWQSNVFASRLFSMIADKGFVLNIDYQNPSGNPSKMASYGDELQSQSAIHNSGWALLAYQNGLFFEEPIGYLKRGNGDASSDQSTAFNSAQSTIRFSSDVTTLMAHVRKASSGCGFNGNGDIPDNPHPWIWITETGITYTFAHNGTIDNKGELRDLIELVEPGFIAENEGLQTFGEAGCGGDWDDDGPGFANVIDSEVYFFWLMQHVLEENGDVLQGLKNAMSDVDFKTITHDNNLNFTFSDGSTIWAYKNATSDDSNDANYRHTLYWIDNDAPLGQYFYHYKAVMSQPTTPALWTSMSDDQLVILPNYGDAVVLSGFSADNHIGRKELSSSWNWIGFPVLSNIDETPLANVMEYLVPHALELNSQGINSEFQVFTGLWSTNYDLNSRAGYKLKMSNAQNSFNFYSMGELIQPDAPITLEPGENWVNYFLDETQHPFDVLEQDVINRLTSIRGQHWYIYKFKGQWYQAEPSGCGGPDPNESCVLFRYGSMYEFTLSGGEDVTLRWQTTQALPRGKSVTTTSFQVNELADYSALIVDTVEDPETVSEIGIFIGDDCIGADPVNEFPIYMKAYNGDQPLDEVTFQIVREPGLAKGINHSETEHQQGNVTLEHYRLSHLDHEIVDSGFPVYHADLEKIPEPMITESSLIACYPNPFNPSTTLRYELVKDAPVSVVVYNMQGRVVENLHQGNQIRGQHELIWDASTKESGLYFVVFKTGDYQTTQKVMLLK